MVSLQSFGKHVRLCSHDLYCYFCEPLSRGSLAQQNLFIQVPYNSSTMVNELFYNCSLQLPARCRNYRALLNHLSNKIELSIKLSNQRGQLVVERVIALLENSLLNHEVELISIIPRFQQHLVGWYVSRNERDNPSCLTGHESRTVRTS